MRTTLTLDPDVEAMLEAHRRRHRLGLKEAVNEALRRGLQADLAAPLRRRPFKTKEVDHGRALIVNADDIGGVLEHLEGSSHR